MMFHFGGNGMTSNDILSYCLSNLKDKEKDGDHDKGSMLNRNNVYRVNIGLRKQTFIKKFGYIPERPSAGKIVKMDYDFTAFDTIISQNKSETW